MSEASESASQQFERESALELLREHYHIPAILGIMAFMFWVRTRFWERFVVDGTVLFTGNDAWYHLRSTQYTVHNWPFTMPFDPWTHFPVGTSSGQFGTLFDQIVATAALIIGLGSPSDHQIRLVLLFAPAVFGTLTAIPVYYLGKKVAGRAGALIGVLILGFSSGQFLVRSVAGFSDHHIAEAFFLSVTAALVVYALTVARRDRPIWELFVEREWDELKPTLVWSGLAGLALTLYLWTWPPGVFFIGILGIFYVISMAYYQAAGESPEPLAVTGVVLGLVAGVLTLVTIDSFEVSATGLTLLQPMLAFGLAAGCAFMAGLARVWDDRDVDQTYYPAAIASILVVGTALFWLVLPGLFDYVVGQVSRVFGYVATAESRTVSEAKPVPLNNLASFFFGNYGLAFFTAIGGFGHMLYRVARGDDRPDYVFLLVLSVFLFLAAMTQVRFDYYFVVPVAVLNAYLAAVVFRMVDLGAIGDSLDDVEAYQILTVVTIVLLVVAPLTVSGGAVAVSDRRSNPGSVQNWQGSLEWLQGNTPAEGQYGGANGNIEYYGTFDKTDDYNYEEGEYGVMSWWDYGHWITTLGHRIPDANPFQQGATKAANFLLAPNETQANRYMVSDSGEETRYVMIDYQLGRAGTQKFSAPTAFESEYNLTSWGTDAAVTRPILNSQGQRVIGTLHTPRSYESMRVRLYQFNGARLNPGSSLGPVVVFDYDVRTVGGTQYAIAPQQGFQKQFQNYSAAKAFVEREGSAQIGGLPGRPSKPVPALEHYRLVHASEVTAGRYSAVKTFEKVPGATVQGTGPANTTVTASVQMRMQTTNRTFTYTQQAQTGPNGQFTMTLPYSTTGYDNWGLEEGYTNVSVKATGPYTFATPGERNQDAGTVTRFEATAQVPEGKVIGEDGSPVQVALQQKTVNVSQGGGNGTNGTNTSDGSGSGGAGDGSVDNTTNASSQSLTPPSSQYRARAA